MCIHLFHHKRGGLNNVCQLPFILHTMPNISCLVQYTFPSQGDIRTTKLSNAVGW